MTVEKIGFQEVAELDLEDILAVEDAALPKHFLLIARRATSAQLRAFLFDTPISETAVDDDAEEKAELEVEYVDRRCEVVRRMRQGISAFDSVFEMLKADPKPGEGGSAD